MGFVTIIQRDELRARVVEELKTGLDINSDAKDSVIEDNGYNSTSDSRCLLQFDKLRVIEMETIELDWQGAFSYEQLLRDEKESWKNFDCAGVYIYTDKTKSEGRVISYVGKAQGAPSLLVRQFQHYMCMIGGQYRMSAESRQSKKAWAVDYKDADVLATIFDRDKFIELVDDCFDYARTVPEIYLAPCKEKNGPQISLIEHNLIFDLQPKDNTRGRYTAPATQLSFVHKNAIWKDIWSNDAKIERHKFV